MINLLPPKEKEDYIVERRERITIILGTLFLYGLVGFACILFFINIALKREIVYQQYEVNQIKKDYEQSGVKNFQQEINLFNKDLEKFQKFYSGKEYFSNIISEVAAVLPPGIYLNSMSVDFEKGSKSSYFAVSISGFSPTRDDLFKLKKNFEKNSNFIDINFPPDNWVKPGNIEFFINFKAKPNDKK